MGTRGLVVTGLSQICGRACVTLRFKAQWALDDIVFLLLRGWECFRIWRAWFCGCRLERGPGRTMSSRSKRGRVSIICERFGKTYMGRIDQKRASLGFRWGNLGGLLLMSRYVLS